jgi:DNA-binding CsgD family transcriptional regulator
VAAGAPVIRQLPPALVAQWIEQRFPKPRVAGSIPAGGTPSTSANALPDGPRRALLWPGCGQHCSARFRKVRPSRRSVRRCYLRRVSSEEAAEPRLTPREQEILRVVAQGRTYWQIADMLHIGSGVMRTHVENIKKKLQLRRRSELMRWYATHKDDLDP